MPAKQRMGWIDGIEKALREAQVKLAADPRPAIAALEKHLDRLARDGIELPYLADRLPLIPAVLPGSWAGRLEAGCREMFNGIEAIFQGAFHGDTHRLADYLLFAPEERVLLGVDSGRYDWAAVARPDFLASQCGPALIESNITTSIGLLEAGLLGDVLLDIPAVRELVVAARLTTVDPARALVQAIAHSLPAGANRFVVLADWSDELGTWLHAYRYLSSLLQAYGVQAEPFALEQLDVRMDGVYAGDRRVDVVYRFYTTTRLPDPRFAALHEPLLAAIKSGRVCLFGAYGHKLFTPKLFLALLSDERFTDQLPRVTVETLRDILPWTRIVEDRRTLCHGKPVDLLAFAAAHRDDLVLKPNLGYGGKNVTVGSEVSQSEWEDKLSAALAAEEHWLLQEKVQAPEAELAFLIDGRVEMRSSKVDYGVFMIGRKFAGVARRNATSMTGPVLTNLSRGGGLSPVFFGA